MRNTSVLTSFNGIEVVLGMFILSIVGCALYSAGRQYSDAVAKLAAMDMQDSYIALCNEGEVFEHANVEYRCERVQYSAVKRVMPDRSSLALSKK